MPNKDELSDQPVIPSSLTPPDNLSFNPSIHLSAYPEPELTHVHMSGTLVSLLDV
jgi:hypothetical protein